MHKLHNFHMTRPSLSLKWKIQQLIFFAINWYLIAQWCFSPYIYIFFQIMHVPIMFSYLLTIYISNPKLLHTTKIPVHLHACIKLDICIEWWIQFCFSNTLLGFYSFCSSFLHSFLGAVCFSRMCRVYV